MKKSIGGSWYAALIVGAAVSCGGDPIEGTGSGRGSESDTTDGNTASASAATQSTQTASATGDASAGTVSGTSASTSGTSNSSDATSSGTTNVDGSTGGSTTNNIDPTTSGTTETSDTSGTSGTTGGPQCPPAQNDSGCLSCIKSDCCDELSACFTSVLCQCWAECGLLQDNESCGDTCLGAAPAAYHELFMCGESSCDESCEVFD